MFHVEHPHDEDDSRLGSVERCQMVPILETPKRFDRRANLWNYYRDYHRNIAEDSMKVVTYLPPNQNDFHILELDIPPHEDYVVVVQDGPGETPSIACRGDTMEAAKAAYNALP